ncbi:MAG TPA: L-threonylcarbamoyladenylate synthase [Methanotrichaceae archaeon]|nr:L-threonylcarbamoyladenylate synthase [Methanotrichaceae archaeon]HQF16550.1 L-threonylcarbamoyladenylate synthase [Methanotrichaceae archaeon]HQI91079.1 L-threonylcarbamoyladenylate synthase [Methanotrichaceae archaeon]HQJ28530.1 L-threonylcarbamoyladenylate synthase [Methanotrichaceae archaeon]
MTQERDEADDGAFKGVPTDAAISAARVIRSGGAVIYPTETVYGIGADALSEAAVARVFAIKCRQMDRPLFLAVSSFEMLSEVALVEPDEMAILRKLLPGPIAFLLRKKPHVPDILTAGSPFVGIRFPDHELALALIEEAGPITSSSANITGHLPPVRASEVDRVLASRVEMVMDGGRCRYAIPSTLVDLANKKILRAGALADRVREELR